MIDTHCHLLPGLDDGPQTGSEALGLATALLRDGVTHAICTPHYSRRFPTDHRQASVALHALQERLAAKHIPLDMSLAAEVSAVGVTAAPDAELAARSIASRYLLIEVEPDTPVGFFEVAATRLETLGLEPIFAHPERCRAVQRQPELVGAARQQGAFIQVVAPSLLGRWGEEVARTAWGFVERGETDLVASDAHGPVRRRPHLRDAARAIEARYGSAARRRLTEETPSLVLHGAARAAPTGERW